MAYLCKFTLFILGITLILPIKNGFAGTPVSICGEPAAPFLYETAGGNQEKKDIAGIHLGNFQLLSELTGLKFTFDILPWKRCLNYVENYSKLGDPEIAIDATFNTERAKKFLYVGPMYAISTAVFYSRKRFPDGPRSKKTGGVISWINEMQHFSICGILGWNYEMYYVEHGIPRSNKVIRTPAGYQGMFRMLSSGRCDLVETHPALVLGTMIAGDLDMPKDIACSKMNEEPEKFYMIVARKSPRAEELVARLSTALIYLKRTLQWKSIKDKGVLPASGIMNSINECL
jgi:polar amino acid transport system substrate-binding protein